MFSCWFSVDRNAWNVTAAVWRGICAVAGLEYSIRCAVVVTVVPIRGNFFFSLKTVAVAGIV